MALPKEPRQKMINLMYLVLTALLALNVSSEILNAFKTVNGSLSKSNSTLDLSSKDVYNSFADALGKPESREKATLLKPKADSIAAISKTFDTYIDGLKQQVLKEAGLDPATGIYKEDDLEAATRLMDTKGEGKNLFAGIQKYVTDISRILGPEYLRKAFPTGMPVGLDSSMDAKTWTTKYFHMVPSVASITMLSKFQNDVKNTENQAVKQLLSEIGKVVVKFDKTDVLVGQSSNYVMPGQEITVTAGIGAYSSAAAPSISIGGSNVPVVDGKGTYKFAANGAGPHKLAVTINYKDQDGQPQTKTQDIEYTVGTPGGAAVMLDKMNVFYIGVDNPVTIGSPTGWDKTDVSMNGGTLSGSGSSRTVRVSGGTTATITVSPDGKPTTFNFRVKRIPNPVFKVADGKPRMPAVTFKNQQFCRADLENFDFDLKFSVVSATVYFSGAGFLNNVAQTSITGNSLAPLATFMSRCGPGSVITFDNVKVSGPDGPRSIDGISIALY